MPAAEHHPTPPRPQPADLRRALDSAIAVDGSSVELERLVRGYVRTLRDMEVPPEQALRRVKQAVGSLPSLSLARPAAPEGAVADRLVTWFLAEYYRAD